ncbi:hypothetical protein E3N88_07796 [Mikania micrantha]|uniref:Uncharacterized protein n=1 Tax=Mikania micrantha TaxID=192012 RepID=A0A5N6PGE9_9ASTR|nr:hypothetical protein E3N88_07796 [Mikania micrantha]
MGEGGEVEVRPREDREDARKPGVKVGDEGQRDQSKNRAAESGPDRSRSFVSIQIFMMRWLNEEMIGKKDDLSKHN